jgi:hypothetical protein
MSIFTKQILAAKKKKTGSLVKLISTNQKVILAVKKY